MWKPCDSNFSRLVTIHSRHRQTTDTEHIMTKGKSRLNEIKQSTTTATRARYSCLGWLYSTALIQSIYLFTNDKTGKLSWTKSTQCRNFVTTTIWLALVIWVDVLVIIIWCVRRAEWKLTAVTQVLRLTTTRTVRGMRKTFRSQDCILVSNSLEVVCSDKYEERVMLNNANNGH